jgi:uncharacterized membrane protein
MMELIVCTFDGATKAETAKKAIQELDEELDSVKLGNIAVLSKDETGKFSFKETGQAEALTQGTTIGALCGAIMGMLAGPIGLAAGAAAGTVVGSAVGVIDLGFPDPVLKQLGEQLKAGSSALVFLLKPEERDVIVEELQQQGGALIEHTLSNEIVAKLMAAAKLPGVKP